MSARAQTRSTMASLGALGAAILTGSGAVADMANIGASAFVQGYGRDAEMEADRIGMKYLVKAGYDPTAMAPRVPDLPGAGNFRDGQRAHRRARAAGLPRRVFLASRAR